jgi:hypothetical protein
MSLEKLGITAKYDAKNENLLVYNVNIDGREFKTPAETNKYFKNVVHTIANNAKKVKATNVKINIDEPYRDLAKREFSRLKNKNNSNRHLLNDVIEKVAIGGMVVGGLAGVVFGADLSSDYMTETITNMNNNSSYLVQKLSGISNTLTGLIGATLGGAAGGTVGLIGSGFAVRGIGSIFIQNDSESNLYSQLHRNFDK